MKISERLKIIKAGKKLLAAKIKACHEAGYTYAVIAKKFNLNESTIRAIIKGN